MNEFRKIIEDLIDLFRDLTALENVKLNAGRNHQVAAIEECMTKENSYILRLKGLDKAREEKQKALGFSGLSFQEILNKVPIEEQEILLPLFDTLSRQIQMFQEVSEDTARIIEVNLRQLTKEIESRQGEIYQNPGAVKVEAGHFTDRSV